MKSVEQIDAAQNICLDQDQCLTLKQKIHLLETVLGKNLRLEKLGRGFVPVYYSVTGKRIILLTKCVTYLGHPHPISKKRIQIPPQFKEIALFYQNKPSYEVKYIGIYTYNGLHILVDFDTTRYIKGKSHNSSAHVYTNDLYQALIYGYFSKTDAKGNKITTILKRNFKDYLDNGITKRMPVIDFLDDFNKRFPFEKNILAKDAITEMYKHHYPEWRQTEWAGWYLEYLLSSYLDKNKLKDVVIFVASLDKLSRSKRLDFDLYFPKYDFYGDLKASDITKTEAPGNDQEAVLTALSQCGRLWYLIYEHETRMDADMANHPMATWRKEFVKKNSPDNKKVGDYIKRMKHSVRFKRMCVYEINRVNLQQALKDFNQGKQADKVHTRRPKFSIKKDIDNFVIYRYLK